jgi:phage shock protein C
MADLNWLQRYAKSDTDYWIAGVCGGLGEVTPGPSWAWRVVFVATTCLGGFGVLLYLAMWLFAPSRHPLRDVPPGAESAPHR